jgi:cell division protein FtsQ
MSASAFEEKDLKVFRAIAEQSAFALYNEAIYLEAGEKRLIDRDLEIARDIQRILLPEVDPVPALERVIALDKAETLLARDVIAVDLRNEDRPVLRLAPDAMNTLRASQGVETGANSL